MRDAGIGRLMVASLHQGIADRLPDRLEFYENWLNPRGLRDGTIGLAPLHAVLSFLRTEGDDYARVTTRPASTRRSGPSASCRRRGAGRRRRLPGPLRRRLALGVARTLITRAYTGSRTHLSLRKTLGTLEIKSSIFCGVRDRAPAPFCQFHAAAIARVLKELDIPARTTIVACQATGDGVCRVEIDMARPAMEPA